MGLKIRGLCKAYDSLTVLRNVTLDVEEGEFICIVGSSGCGKTTLLRIIAGFESYVGDVLHNRNPIEEPSPKRFMVFQELNQLLPWKTVKENILFGLVSDNSENKISVDNLINLVGLDSFDNYYPHQLSGGMKQRVAIARALFMNPSILLMDEPFGSLDAHTRRKMRFELLKIWEKVNKTVIFVTHNIRESIQLADRVIILSRRGEVKATINIDLPRPRDVTSYSFGVYWNKIMSFIEVK